MQNDLQQGAINLYPTLLIKRGGQFRPFYICAPVAQMEELLPAKLEVVSSSLTGGTDISYVNPSAEVAFVGGIFRSSTG